MTDKKIIKYTPDLLSEARKVSGSGAVLPRSPYIKPSYNEEEAPKGNFILKDWDTEKEEYLDRDLGQSFSGSILVVTKKCTQWDPDLGSNIYESNEFFDYEEPIALIKNREVVANGKYRDLKAQYPDLKLQLILYVLIDNRVVKFYVKGKSIIEFGEYEKAILVNKSAIQAHETVFTTKKEQNGAVTYYLIKFKKGKERDLNKMVPLSLKVREGIQLFSDRFREEPPSLTAGDPNTVEAEVVEVNKEEDKEETDDIPTTLPF